MPLRPRCQPVRCDATLVKKMIMSLVFAVDNLLDGFGLVCLDRRSNECMNEWLHEWPSQRRALPRRHSWSHLVSSSPSHLISSRHISSSLIHQVPILKEAFGDDYWVCMLLFSACVLLGAVCTALLRHFAPSPVFHLIWLSLATTSILVGSLQLCSHGLSIYVMTGIGH